jgi:glyoxylase-like metal-dependent hydrolase (beta-lactamase superfamily II)
MPNFICTTCGTQHAETDQPPGNCAICLDERQYVKATGQQWTTHEKLRLTNRNSIRLAEPNLIGLGVDPQFAIGQRALLVRTPKGNVLWDCVPLIDPALVEMVQALGGISAMAISHPHYYTSMVEWSRAFAGVPIYLHAADRQWVMRPDQAIAYWEGESKPLDNGLTLVRCGGHFGGGTVLHWRGGSGGKGALLTGDIIQVVADRKHVSFMYSYPN